MTLRTVPDPRPSRVRDGSAPVALVLLTLIPVIAGSLRLLELAGGPHVLPANPRIDASPAPVVVHVVAAALFAILGAFQFSARLRRHRPGWHRRAGRVLVVAGLVVAGSGLWMTLFYAGAPGGTLLWSVRLLVGTGLAAALGLGFTAIRRHDIAAHRAWMMRAYALAVGAGTQTFTQGVGQAAFGTGGWSTGISISSGWVINVLAAEWLIRRRA
jgi:uncharacterized membrane protein